MQLLHCVLILAAGCCLHCPPVTEAANVLMLPYAYGMNSRFRDMIYMTELMIKKQHHHITVIINEDDYQHMKYLENIELENTHSFGSADDNAESDNTGQERNRETSNSSGTKGTANMPEQQKAGITFITFPYPENTLKAGDEKVERELMDLSGLAFLRVIDLVNSVMFNMCHQIFTNKKVMDVMMKEKFDLFITDLADSCSRVTVAVLDIPTVAYSSHGTILDPVFFPEMMSISPLLFTDMSDEMTFGERVGNCIGNIVNRGIMYYQETVAQRFIREHEIKLKKPLVSAWVASLVLLGSDYTFEYPRPLMPNIIPIGGFYLKPAKPLEGDISSFVNKAGKFGVAYVSFGTMVSKLEPERMQLLARVFRKLPEMSFIWKYNGPDLEVSSNVHLVQWAPQNDILGHHKTKLFITHCGSHSTYETIYHGVPVVTVPLFTDQPSNAKRLVHRLAMGVHVDFRTMTETELEQAIRDVITNTSYADNAKAASASYLDQINHPVDRMLYYIDYAVRRGGAAHLASKPLAQLNHLQLYSVDVALFLTLVFAVLIVTLIFVLCYFCKCIKRLVCGKNKVKTA